MLPTSTELDICKMDLFVAIDELMRVCYLKFGSVCTAPESDLVAILTQFFLTLSSQMKGLD